MKKYNNINILNNKINLFHIEKHSPGMIFWNENGLIIFNELKQFIRKILFKNLYIEVKTPILINKILWEKSEHLKYFKENIFICKNKKNEFCIKPMNCPAHICIYNNKIRSYKDLPIRISEFGNCFRIEPSGSLYNLMRTRSFHQDDGHIFCTYEQIENEIENCINIMYKIYNVFNFKNIEVYFSTRPKNKIGDDKIWDISENLIIKILKKKNINFIINSEEGAFYGPKIEFILLDYIDRKWQCGTIQLDFFLSNKLNSFYIDKNNIKKNTIIIHRAILGSIERFIGIITEHYNIKYPIWISPIQIVIVNISDKSINYSNKIFNILIENNIRVKLDIQNKKINFKLKKYINISIPYIIICGEKENKFNIISVRKRNNNKTIYYNIYSFIKIIKYEIENKII